jgi:dCMP deaminase
MQMSKRQKTRQEKWDKRYLKLCKEISTWSKDPSTKVGSVITDGTRFVSLGFNGMPEKIPDLELLLNVRELKLKHIIHAEVNAICFSNRASLDGCTIYTYPFLPCCQCSPQIIQRGISRVVSQVCVEKRWEGNLKESKHFMNMAGLEVVEYPFETA